MIPVTFAAPPISKRQKDIVNPAPERYSGTGGRKGTGYNYDDPRNKIVQQGIHHLYTKYGIYPLIGSSLTTIGPVTEENNRLTRFDLLAYCAVYPQNGYVSYNAASPTASPYEVLQPSDYACWTELELNTQVPSIKQILSITTPESQQPRFQTNMTEQEGTLTGSTAVAQLPSFAIELPEGRLRDIETIFSASLGQNASVITTREPISDTVIFQQPENIDFDDWTANVTAEKDPFVIYRNAKERKFYYVARLTEKNPGSYDSSTSEGFAARRQFGIQALTKIANFTNKTVNFESSILDQLLIEGTYGAPDRPNPPPNSTTWRMAASIDESIIRGLDSNFKVGEDIPHIAKAFRDFLESANIQRKATIRVGDIKKTVKATERALSEYDKILSEEQITPEMLRGLRLDEEAAKLSSFPKNIERFIGANNITDSPSDLLEISFDAEFNPRCIIYNGEIKTKGLGFSFTSQGISSDPSAGDNTMSGVSPTTFGYFFYARDIVTASRNKKDPMPWSQFIPSFTYPNPCLKPTEIQNQIEENRRKNKGLDATSAKDKLFKTDSEVQAATR